MIKATGRGSYKRVRLDKYGFPRGQLMRQKSVFGFQTGDLVKAHIPKGKKQGNYRGRVAVRASGYFNVQTSTDVIQGVSHRHCKILQRGDGYCYYSHGENLDAVGILPIPPRRPEGRGISAEL